MPLLTGTKFKVIQNGVKYLSQMCKHLSMD